MQLDTFHELSVVLVSVWGGESERLYSSLQDPQQHADVARHTCEQQVRTQARPDAG